MKIDTFYRSRWVQVLGMAYWGITDVLCLNVNDDSRDSDSLRDYISGILRCKEELIELIPADVLPPALRGGAGYPVGMIGQYIISELRQEMNPLDKLGRTSVLTGCLMGTMFIETKRRLLSSAAARGVEGIEGVLPGSLFGFPPFKDEVLEGVDWFLCSLGSLIREFDLDRQRLLLTFGVDDPEDIQELSWVDDPSLWHKRNDRHKQYNTFPRTHAITAVNILLEKLGVYKNTDKVKIAEFVEAVTGGNINAEGKNTASYKPPTKDAEVAAKDLLGKINL